MPFDARLEAPAVKSALDDPRQGEQPAKWLGQSPRTHGFAAKPRTLSRIRAWSQTKRGPLANFCADDFMHMGARWEQSLLDARTRASLLRSSFDHEALDLLYPFASKVVKLMTAASPADRNAAELSQLLVVVGCRYWIH